MSKIPEHSSKCFVRLADGRAIPVLVINVGYWQERGGYLTIFIVGELDAPVVSLVSLPFHQQFICPDPPLRAECDGQELIGAVTDFYGAVDDIELLEDA